jgi:hypothetical protein
MASIHRQLILHGLPLPSELIRMVKEYTFMDITEANSKKRKNVITHLFGHTLWCGKASPLEEVTDYVFWINEDAKSPQIQARFCKKCGNYTFSNFRDTIYHTVVCRC